MKPTAEEREKPEQEVTEGTEKVDPEGKPKEEEGAPAAAATEEQPKKEEEEKEAEAEKGLLSEIPEVGAEAEKEPEKEAEKQLAELRTQNEALQSQLEELKTKLTKGDTVPVNVANVHPLFLEDDPAKIANVDAQYARFQEWALQNWDGSEEISENGKVLAPAYTKEQIRSRYAQVQEERTKLVPAAIQAQQMRQAQVAQARKIYPELFDAKRPEHALLEQILKTAPGLKAVFPNIHVIIGDAIVGERIRMQRQKAGAGSSKLQAPISKGKAGNPGAPSPGPRAAAVAKKGAKENVSAKRFVEMGGDRDALVNMLRTVDLPTARE